MFETGKTLYEIIGGKHPFIFTFTVSETELTEQGVFLPDKMIGRCEFTVSDCGVNVFDNYEEALKRIGGGAYEQHVGGLSE